MFKKIKQAVSLALCIVLTITAVPKINTPEINAAPENPNYAEALQKSLYFYEAQQAGPLPEWNRVEWRADSTMGDYVQGGWYDAGDHVKFNLPMAYSAAMIAWGLYQFEDGVKASGQFTEYVNNLEFVLDYLAACDKGSEIVFQVGNGTEDHTWWGAVELVEYGYKEGSYTATRPYYASATGCASVFGEMAAALASGAAALKTINPTKSAQYLTAAKNIFAKADASRNDDVYNKSDAQGFYQAGNNTEWWDQLLFAAEWLYIATGDNAYLAKCDEFITKLPKMNGSSELTYGWGMCWDDNTQGAILLYAIITGDEYYASRVNRHLNAWVDNQEVKLVPGGLRWLTNWGCLRHTTATGFIAAVATDTVLKNDPRKADYDKFAKEQVDYSLGVNPSGQSYQVGYGDKYPLNPHHRTAHASYNNSLEGPPINNRHTIYGALVGGPNQDGSYEDDRGNFINNEIATDYNAGFTALLAALCEQYGGTPDPNFPQPEVRTPEFLVEVKGVSATTGGIQFNAYFKNVTAYPARRQDGMSFRYFVDLSECTADPSTATIRIDWNGMTNRVAGTVHPTATLKQYEGSIYYVEFSYADGRTVLPISEGTYKAEMQCVIELPGWDSSNDYSYQGFMTGATAGVDGKITENICIYQDGVLIFGTEPNGKKPDTTTPPTTKPTTSSTATTTTTTSTSSSTSLTTTITTSSLSVSNTSTTSVNHDAVIGDINLDGNIGISDLIHLAKAISKKVILTDEQKINANCHIDPAINGEDLLALIKYIADKTIVLPLQ